MCNLAQELGVSAFGLNCARYMWRIWQGGNQWSGALAFLTFFRYIAQLPLDYSSWQHWEVLGKHSGPRIIHPDFCMISDRPEVLLVDDQNRPHNEHGPFCRWRDGSALYAVHGVRVPAWIIESPEKITPQSILQENNAEVRRVMIDRYGLERFAQDMRPDSEYEDAFGTVYVKEFDDDEPLVMVKVLNSTPEPDGTHKTYWLRVDPEQYEGKTRYVPQAAVASTWRYQDGTLVFPDYRDYQLAVQT